jgi:glycosyltransferase involved in cell wall biosynthesis
MSLFQTSLYSNFLADEFDFLCPKLHWNFESTTDIQNSILERIEPGIDEIWLFGLSKFKSPKNIVQRQFVFPDQKNIQDFNRVNCLLDDWSTTIELLVDLSSKKDILFCIHGAFLANLSDPRPLLLAFKKISYHRKTNGVIIFDHTKSTDCARKWTVESFGTFLTASGFQVTTHRSPVNPITYLSFTTSEESYKNYLASIGLQQTSLNNQRLYIWTAQDSCDISSDIQKYIAHTKKYDPSAIFLLCNTQPTKLVSDRNTLLYNELINRYFSHESSDSMDIVEVIKVILFALPYIDICEYQDYLSIGFRIVQAKHTGQLPTSLYLRCYLHGSIDYEKYANCGPSAAQYSNLEIKTTIRDAFVYKYSDECRAPSRYLPDLLSKEFGYQLNNITITKPAIDVQSNKSAISQRFTAINKIGFIGGYSCATYWIDFLKIIERLSLDGTLKNVDTIVLYSRIEIDKFDLKKLDQCHLFANKQISYTDFHSYLSKHQADTLFILPIHRESYSYTLLELIASGARFATYDSGGTAELIADEHYSSTFLAKETIDDIVSLVRRLLEQPATKHQSLIDAKRLDFLSSQEQVNYQYNKYNKRIEDIKINDITDSVKNSAVTIITPVFNTNLNYLDDLFNSICNSSIAPVEWLLINDGSSADFLLEMQAFASCRQNRLKIRIASQQNKGAASARNYGLRLTSTKFNLFIDSDDILLPHFLSSSLAAMSKSPELAAVSGFAMFFNDRSSLALNMSPLREHRYWSPLGIPEARAFSIIDNQFISSLTFVNKDLVLQAGGWDESDNSAWEDWAFCANLAWKNFRFSLIPNVGFLYRDTPGSITKTKNPYFGRRRLIRNIPTLTKFDANIITAMAMAADPLTKDGEHRLEAVLNATLNSRSWKLTLPLRIVGDMFRDCLPKIRSIRKLFIPRR